MTSRKPGRVTLSEVARKAGVSAPTASAVLHNSKGNNSGFSAETAERVTAVAQELGYRPNRTARNFYRKRHGAVGLLIGPGAWLPDATLAAISGQARRADQMLVMEFGGDGQDTVPIFLEEDAVDALIVFGDISGEIEDRVRELKLATVHVNTNRRGIPGALTYDERGGMELAVRHLAERGCRHMGFCTETVQDAGHYSVQKRLEGFREACERHDVTSASVLELEHPWVCGLLTDSAEYRAAVDEVLRWCEHNEAVEGLVLSKKTYAPPVYDALGQLDCVIPDDVSVVGVNPYDQVDYMVPRLTSVSLDFAELGRTALGMAARAIEDGIDAVEPVKFPMQLIVGEST